MDSWEIYKALYRHYANYEYKLSNSYLYSWESDFFGMSKAGYFLEVEVKVSRNDYFRDFIKEKHRLFKAVISGKSHFITSSSCQGDYIGSYVSGTLISQYGEYARHMSTVRPWAYETYKGKFGVWANDYGRVAIRHSEHDMYAPATRIRFHELEKTSCPNQLYFACPMGLIKESEIPAYAGLLYCDGSITMIKKAPYLHKRKPDMSKILLSKFYNLWNYNITVERKLELSAAQK